MGLNKRELFIRDKIGLDEQLESEPIVQEMLKAGAIGYMLKLFDFFTLHQFSPA